jgi:hypothetical protein
MVFGFPDLPFSSPRNVLGGHLLSSLIGLTFLQPCGPHWWSLAMARLTGQRPGLDGTQQRFARGRRLMRIRRIDRCTWLGVGNIGMRLLMAIALLMLLPIRGKAVVRHS